MDSQAILEKAIKKAIKGGWNPLNFRDELDKRYKGLKVLSLDYFDSGILLFYEIGKGDTVYRGDVRLGESDYDIIFNHDFAKALWGDTTKSERMWGDRPIPWISHPWKRHLQQMVIADDPIKYLGENI